MKSNRRICIYLAFKTEILCKIFVSFAFEFEMQISFLLTLGSVILKDIAKRIKVIVTKSVWGF